MAIADKYSLGRHIFLAKFMKVKLHCLSNPITQLCKNKCMFDQILQLVKEQMGNNPQIASALPAHQTADIHNEIATHITNGLQAQPPTQSMPGGGFLSNLESSFASGNMATSAIAGGLVGSLGSKFGLSPAITGAIAAALPALLQKYAQRSNGPATA
jgi:hypothetical protein